MTIKTFRWPNRLEGSDKVEPPEFFSKIRWRPANITASKAKIPKTRANIKYEKPQEFLNHKKLTQIKLMKLIKAKSKALPINNDN